MAAPPRSTDMRIESGMYSVPRRNARGPARGATRVICREGSFVGFAAQQVAAKPSLPGWGADLKLIGIAAYNMCARIMTVWTAHPCQYVKIRGIQDTGSGGETFVTLHPQCAALNLLTNVIDQVFGIFVSSLTGDNFSFNDERGSFVLKLQSNYSQTTTTIAMKQSRQLAMHWLRCPADAAPEVPARPPVEARRPNLR
ncbi:hypothetical protein Bbelb_223360 [Branchiostoma belcheri]|nr:hypothetical protein Bbelb_223360 [Branchiostoma belcheri]